MTKLWAVAALMVETQIGITQTLTKKPARATAADTTKVTATVTAIDPTNRIRRAAGPAFAALNDGSSATTKAPGSAYRLKNSSSPP